jgi:hypothetical protein
MRILLHDELERWISFLQVALFQQIQVLSVCFCDESMLLLIVPAAEQVML